MSRTGNDVSVVGLDDIWVTNTPGHIVQQLHVAECRLHSRRCVGSIVGLDDECFPSAGSTLWELVESKQRRDRLGPDPLGASEHSDASANACRSSVAEIF